VAPLNNPRFSGDFPCHHAQPDPVTASYNAGGYVQVGSNVINTQVDDHCQFSYDNRNFIVLKTVFGNYFRAQSYSVPIPRSTRSGHVVFNWSWINAEGNRESYMNCASIQTNGPQNGSITGQQMMVANLAGAPTIEE
jgi:hypothetical protein